MVQDFVHQQYVQPATIPEYTDYLQLSQAAPGLQLQEWSNVGNKTVFIDAQIGVLLDFTNRIWHIRIHIIENKSPCYITHIIHTHICKMVSASEGRLVS